MPGQRVMILGATGALGSRLAVDLSNQFQVISPLPRSSKRLMPELNHVRWLDHPFDADDEASLDGLIRKASPDAVINCVAVTPKHSQASDPRAMHVINAEFPHRLAQQTASCGAYLVHISSDAVFSGKRGNYCETDRPDPIDDYGRTKRLGELNKPGTITLRTTFFGTTPTRSTLIDWFLQQSGERVKAYTRYTFPGLWLGTLSKAIGELITLWDRPSGIYHAGGSAVSKHGLLSEVNAALQLGVSIDKCSEPVCDRSFDSSRFWELLGTEVPSFDSMLRGMLPELIARRQQLSRAA